MDGCAEIYNTKIFQHNHILYVEGELYYGDIIMNILDTANIIAQAFNDRKRIFLVKENSEGLLKPLHSICDFMNINGIHTDVIVAPWEGIINVVQGDDVVISGVSGTDCRISILNAVGAFYIPIKTRHKKSFEVVSYVINDLCFHWKRMANG